MPASTGLPPSCTASTLVTPRAAKETEPNWKKFEGKEKVVKELDQHVYRLLPDLLEGDESVLDKPEFKERLSKRWASAFEGLHSKPRKSKEDWIPQPLMDVLSHNQSQKRTGESCAPGNAGMEVAMLPVLEKEGEYGIENQDLGIKDGGGYGDGYYGYVPKPLMKYLESGEAQKIREDETGPVAPGGRIKDLDQHWKWLLMARRATGLDELREFARGNKLPFKKNSFYDEAAALVGKCVQSYHTTDSQVSDGMEV